MNQATFAEAARDQDRTGAQLLRGFMRDFVRQQQAAAKHDTWFRREVQAGIDAANAGKLIDAENVEAEAAAWRAQTRQNWPELNREAGLDSAAASTARKPGITFIEYMHK